MDASGEERFLPYLGKIIPEVVMKTNQRGPRCALFFCAVALIVIAPLVVAQEETGEQYLSVEEYIEQARPYLHLSCEGAWAEAGEDGQAYVDIINKIVAIGFINHDFDIKKLEALPAEELEATQVAYYNEVGRLCKENPRYLLAGVVEEALVGQFAKIAPEGELEE
jgi:hypothetical protein